MIYLNILLLILVSILPIIVIGAYIYKKDRNKEPMKLLLTLFLCGILSSFLVIVISTILGLFFPKLLSDFTNLNLIELVFYIFICIALVEEFCKWLLIYQVTYNSKEFDEVYDMIVYSVFVSLGFAFIENLLYVLDGGLVTGIARAFFSVPGHACDAVFMGYYLALSKVSKINGRIDLSKNYFWFSIIVPTVLHGIYDYCVFTNLWIFAIIFFFFIIYLYLGAIKKIKVLSKSSERIRKYCNNCGSEVEGKYCANCGVKQDI